MIVRIIVTKSCFVYHVPSITLSDFNILNPFILWLCCEVTAVTSDLHLKKLVAHGILMASDKPVSETCQQMHCIYGIPFPAYEGAGFVFLFH